MNGPFGDDLLPALQLLFGFIRPYVKTFIIAILLLNPFPQLQVLPNWSTAIPAQAAQPLLVIATAYLGGFFKLPHVDPQAANGAWAALIAPLAAFHTVSKRIGSYFKAGLLISLSFYMPIYHAVPLPFQPWFWGVLLSLAMLTGFYSPTAKFNGPFRYGYLKYSTYFAQFYSRLLDWWFYTALFIVFSHILLPVLLLGLVATTLAAWVYIYREYSEELDKITVDVADSTAKASLAATSVYEYATAASRYETAIISAATGTRRDALIASSVRTTDFFHVATEAWAALGTVTQPTGDARAKAAELASKAFDVDELDKPDEESGRSAILSEYLLEKSSQALKLAEEVEAKLHVAQEAVRKSQVAEQQDRDARGKARTDATAAANAARNLANKIKGLPDTKYTAEEEVEKARRFGTNAVTAATEGEMAKAWAAAGVAKNEANKAVQSMKTLRTSVEGAQEVLLQWLEKESN